MLEQLASSYAVLADDEKERLSAWSEIARIMQEARRKLIEKYKTDF